MGSRVHRQHQHREMLTVTSATSASRPSNTRVADRPRVASRAAALVAPAALSFVRPLLTPSAPARRGAGCPTRRERRAAQHSRWATARERGHRGCVPRAPSGERGGLRPTRRRRHRSRPPADAPAVRPGGHAPWALEAERPALHPPAWDRRAAQSSSTPAPARTARRIRAGQRAGGCQHAPDLDGHLPAGAVCWPAATLGRSTSRCRRSAGARSVRTIGADSPDPHAAWTPDAAPGAIDVSCHPPLATPGTTTGLRWLQLPQRRRLAGELGALTVPTRSGATDRPTCWRGLASPTAAVSPKDSCHGDQIHPLPRTDCATHTGRSPHRSGGCDRPETGSDSLAFFRHFRLCSRSPAAFAAVDAARATVELRQGSGCAGCAVVLCGDAELLVSGAD